MCVGWFVRTHCVVTGIAVAIVAVLVALAVVVCDVANTRPAKLPVVAGSKWNLSLQVPLCW